MKIYLIYLAFFFSLSLPAIDTNSYMLRLLNRSDKNWLKVITPKLDFGMITKNNFNYQKINTEFFIRLTWNNDTISLTKQKNIINTVKKWILINKKYEL